MSHDLTNRGHGDDVGRWQSCLVPLRGQGTACAMATMAGGEKSLSACMEMALEATIQDGNDTK